MAVVSARSKRWRGLQQLQAPLEVAGLDRPDEERDEPRQTAAFVRRNLALPGGRNDRRHRAGEIGGIPHRRQLYRHGALAPRRPDTVEAHPRAVGLTGNMRWAFNGKFSLLPQTLPWF